VTPAITAHSSTLPNVIPRIEGVVEHGDARGCAIGFPRANISVPDGHLRDGVWAGTVELGPAQGIRSYAAAISVGRRPTYYHKGARLLEAHFSITPGTCTDTPFW
jgi:FAD synthase